MTHLPPLLCCLVGFAALALAMPRPQEQVWRKLLPAGTIRCLRTAGTAMLLLALGLLVGRHGWGLGLVAYGGHTSLAAGIVFWVLIVHGRMRARRD
jgi:hypothetical protein